MKTAATRDLPRIRAEIEDFLKSAREPALLEPGEELLPLNSENYALEMRGSRLTLQAWDRTRNWSRRLTAITAATNPRPHHRPPLSHGGTLRPPRRPDVPPRPGPPLRRGAQQAQRPPGLPRALPPLPAPPVSRVDPGRGQRRGRPPALPFPRLPARLPQARAARMGRHRLPARCRFRRRALLRSHLARLPPHTGAARGAGRAGRLPPRRPGARRRPAPPLPRFPGRPLRALHLPP